MANKDQSAQKMTSLLKAKPPGINPAVKQIFLMLLLASSILNLLAPGPAQARDASITDFFITNTEEEVLVYLRVKDCFSPEMEEAILAGITTTFLLTIELYQRRGLWFDKKESTLEVRHSLKYDNVKRILYLSHSYRSGEPQQFTELGKAKRAMSDVSGLPVASLSSLARGQHYYVRVRAKLDKATLPMDIRSTMVFFSLWYFETDWARQDFVY
ncbi:MAG: DUF4390 domain-containing protein [Syntrophales bacterium]|nr:DUF4390 domain-containing protein [Syntrophales bacterium]